MTAWAPASAARARQIGGRPVHLPNWTSRMIVRAGGDNRRRQTQHVDFFERFEQRPFASQSANHKSGERGTAPLIEVMLDLSAIYGAGMIERRRGRPQILPVISCESIMFSIDLECKTSRQGKSPSRIYGNPDRPESLKSRTGTTLRGSAHFFDDDSRQAQLLARFGGEAATGRYARLGRLRARAPETHGDREQDLRHSGMA